MYLSIAFLECNAFLSVKDIQETAECFGENKFIFDDVSIWQALKTVTYRMGKLEKSFYQTE